jgi:hypothetical protein
MRLENTIKGAGLGVAVGVFLYLLKVSGIEGSNLIVQNTLETYSASFIPSISLSGGAAGGLIDIASYLDVRSGR